MIYINICYMCSEIEERSIYDIASNYVINVES